MGVGDSEAANKVVRYGAAEGGAPPPPEPTSSRTPRIIKTSAEKFVPPSDGEACRAMLPPSLNALVTQLTTVEEAIETAAGVTETRVHMAARDEKTTTERRLRNELMKAELKELSERVREAWRRPVEVSASTRVTDELKDATDRARRASRQQQNRLAERGDTKEHAKWMQHRLKLTPKQLKEEEQLEAYRKSGGNKRRGTAAAAAAPSAANLNRRPRRVGGVSGGTAGLRLLDYEGGMAPAPAPADEEEEADKEEEEDDADFQRRGMAIKCTRPSYGHRLGLEDDDAVLEVIHDRINALSMKTDAECV